MRIFGAGPAGAPCRAGVQDRLHAGAAFYTLLFARPALPASDFSAGLLCFRRCLCNILLSCHRIVFMNVRLRLPRTVKTGIAADKGRGSLFVPRISCFSIFAAGAGLNFLHFPSH